MWNTYKLISQKAFFFHLNKKVSHISLIKVRALMLMEKQWTGNAPGVHFSPRRQWEMPCWGSWGCVPLGRDMWCTVLGDVSRAGEAVQCSTPGSHSCPGHRYKPAQIQTGTCILVRAFSFVFILSFSFTVTWTCSCLFLFFSWEKRCEADCMIQSCTELGLGWGGPCSGEGF